MDALGAFFVGLGIGCLFTFILIGGSVSETASKVNKWKDTAIEQKVGYYSPTTGEFQLVIIPEEQLKRYIEDNPSQLKDKDE